ncbi:MAG: hypothetical protein ACR2RF_33100 [Geminicoccaceae bacterium]
MTGAILTATDRFLAGAQPKVILPDNIRSLTGFQPNLLQQELLQLKARFQVHMVHRRGTKSVCYINHMVERAIECPFPSPKYLYTAQALDQAVEIAWEYLVELADLIPGGATHKRNFSITLPTRAGHRAQIMLKGTDSIGERVRGKYLDGVVNDEAAFDSPSYWRSKIRPMLSDRGRRGFDRNGYPNQWSVRLSTPAGRNHFYRAHRDATAWMQGRTVIQRNPKTGVEKEVSRNNWAAVFRPVTDTDILDQEEIDELQIDLTEAEFKREYMLDVDAMVEGAIYGDELGRLRKHGLIDLCPYNPDYPVNTCWDKGWHDKVAWFFQLIGPSVNWIDFGWWRQKRWGRVVSDMQRKGWKWGSHVFPHDARHHNDDGHQCMATLRGYGIKMTDAPKLLKQDGCEIAQKILLRSRFDEPRCAEGIDALALYQVDYDEETETWSDDVAKKFTRHPADAFRIGAVWINKTMNGRA